MRQLKILGVAIFAIFALGLTATSAMALLPDVHCLKSEEPGCYPLHINYSSGTETSELQSTGGGALEGTGVSVLLLMTELSALGTFGATFLNVLERTNKEKCNTKGDKAGSVVTKGEFHIVYIKLSSAGETLTIGVAFLPEEVEIKCAKLTVKVRGCVLSTLQPENPSETELDVTQVIGALKGEKGKNKLTEYDNSAGTKVKCILESNFETGFKQSMEVVGASGGASVLFESLENKTTKKPQMFTILNE